MKVGETVPEIVLPAIEGTRFNSRTLENKRYLLTFFRFATCPLCNMRVAQLKHLKQELGEEFEVVAIFESEIENLKKHASRHLATFPILADSERKYYRLFRVRRSVIGMLKGLLIRMPTLMKGLLKGYIPKEVSSRLLIMPLSLLVDEKGIIRTIYHGRDEGDHIPLETVKRFAIGNS